MSNTYRARRDFACDENGTKIEVYGIDCICSGQIAFSVPDIFFELEKAEAFVKLCNDCDLDPAQIWDVVDDILTEQYSK